MGGIRERIGIIRQRKPSARENIPPRYEDGATDVEPLTAFVEMGLIMHAAREEGRRLTPEENIRLEDLAVPVYYAEGQDKEQIDDTLRYMREEGRQGNRRARMIAGEISGRVNAVAFYERGGRHGGRR